MSKGPVKECVRSRTPPRERIIETARDLFHKHGLRGVGVDAIAEAAGTNKMTLYRHFGSKDDLIAACLTEAGREAAQEWDEWEAEFANDPKKLLLEWIDCAMACAVEDPRGCDIANAAVEITEPDHPARKVIAQVKTDHRDRLARICHAAGFRDAELLADALTLLVEGARVSWQSVGPEGPGSRFVQAAQAIVAAFGGPKT
ncbi:transcriptional regulator, TetR family [Rhodoblastus acidophilus]|uniref:Transcriptional regulator, TetR family n=1 Tax=Rhodoblastus acidophilus TaxID=1074 RepID=A0A212S7F0_RHOAC|nr:TetR/AcrR family transcriptional regulator [Rhodoblastus acidophilus]PPQ37230.1 TetR/AcrR family transcriptional regulator [Rhodoblastus acidophilus]RAI17302.1 TetR/AcrR family transcriptional regulator [Rhodoblastus acidophilus]SNB81040.1 transcriptional regulator, TetR family [Rhodoblastus acidophilus]